MAKGGEFERNICKQLSLWWTENERDDIFWRTAGSGARHTTRQKKNISTENSAGDVCYIDQLGKPFIDYFLMELKRGYTSKGRLTQKLMEEIRFILVELVAPVEKKLQAIKKVFAKTKKSGKMIDPLDLIDSKAKTDSTLIEWWKKAEKEREEAVRKDSIIIFQRDMKNTSIMMGKMFFFNIFDWAYIEAQEKMKRILILSDNSLREDLYIVEFDKFLDAIPAKVFKKYLKERENEE